MRCEQRCFLIGYFKKEWIKKMSSLSLEESIKKGLSKPPEIHLHGIKDLVPNICHNVQEIYKTVEKEEAYLTTPFHNQLHHEVLLPKTVDQKFLNYQVLWDEVLKNEDEKFCSYKALHLILPLSQEKSLSYNVYLCRQIAKTHFINQNVAVQIDIHKGDELDSYPHAHFLVVPYIFSKEGTVLSEWIDVGFMGKNRY